jgi:ATP-dependent NAD(P)H-hydrate dehydratase
MYAKMYRAKIVQDIKNFFPKLSLTMHKGQGGKICVLGGSKEYTGAPYYAATASLRAGGDLCKLLHI